MCAENYAVDKSERILIVGSSNPEITFLLLPAIKQIREQNRNSKFDIVAGTGCEKILKETGWFERIIICGKFSPIKIYRNTCREKYKMVIAFRPSIIPYIVRAEKKFVFLPNRLFTDRFFTHESVKYLKLIEPVFGKPKENELYFPISESDREKMKEFLKSNNITGSTTIIAIHTGDSKTPDQWDASNYVKLIDVLIDEYNAKVFLFGEIHSSLVKEIIAASKHKDSIRDMSEMINLREIAAFLSRTNLAITRDGIFLYIACSMKTPVVSIFGAGNPYRFGPIGTRYINIHAQIDCFPCDKKRPCKRNYRCIKSIEPENVIEASRLILDEGKQLFLFE